MFSVRTLLALRKSNPCNATQTLGNAMKRLFFSSALGLFCLSVNSQTNLNLNLNVRSTRTIPPLVFTLPPTELRLSPQKLENEEFQSHLSLTGRQAPTADPTAEASPPHWILDNFHSDTERRLYARLRDGGYLERPVRPSDNFLERHVFSIFEPVSVQLGRTTLSCSIITAIKRKNPFCLLNPIVLNLSW